jgi:hypothetical protein
MKLSRLFFFLLSAGLAWPAAGRGADATPTAAPPAAASTGAVILAAPQTGEVVNPVDRDRLLAAAGRNLNRADPALEQHLQTFDNPFFLKLPPPPPEIQPTSPTPAAPEPVAQKLSDTAKLSQLAAVLKPSGTMGMGNVLVLIFEDRPPLRAGQVMDVTFPGEDGPTHILLLSVSQKSYSLKLNDTVMPVSLNPPSSEEGSTPPPTSKP